MKIKKITTNKKQYLSLLLLADEQESMVDKYLDRGKMYVLFQDDTAISECVVTDEGNKILEIKNLATNPDFQHQAMHKNSLNSLNKNIVVSSIFFKLALAIVLSPCLFMKKLVLKSVVANEIFSLIITTIQSSKLENNL
ncbi:N-acetyltransferase [Lactobacillus kitasatonis]|uniref:N-acetyltransferase n=1 Tax=Lactobacillus kitasatonis TaxID=237446 RepID=UPI001FCC427F|nr:N-acetyltransferase [Lactobacillus kitasatonis]